jgi:hypothetical protein
MTLIEGDEKTKSFLATTIDGVNSLQTQYLLFALTVTVLILHQLGPTQEMKEVLLFCLGGFFTYITNDKKAQ